MALNLTNKTTFSGEINARKIALKNGKFVIASLFQGVQKAQETRHCERCNATRGVAILCQLLDFAKA